MELWAWVEAETEEEYVTMLSLVAHHRIDKYSGLLHDGLP